MGPVCFPPRTLSFVAMTLRILPKDVIERLAAGEIVHSAGQALKELMENAIDAGGTKLTITATNQTLQVRDNGCGIRASDFPLLATRFATSKLEDFASLQNVETFGFRGEALCSLSYVGTLRVESTSLATREHTCAQFKDSQMISNSTDSIAKESGTAVSVCFDDIQIDFKEIFRLIKAFSLCNPDVELYFETKEQRFHQPMMQDIKARIENVYNTHEVEEFSITDPQFSATVYLIQGKGRESFCYVNKRLVSK